MQRILHRRIFSYKPHLRLLKTQIFQTSCIFSSELIFLFSILTDCNKKKQWHHSADLLTIFSLPGSKKNARLNK